VLVIRVANPADLNEIAEIHAQSIPYSINSMLGLERLKTLYSVFFSSSAHHLFVADDEGSIVGFISGTANYTSLMRVARGSISLKQLSVVAKKIGLFKFVRLILDWLIIDHKFKRLDHFYYFSTWGVRSDSNPTAGSLLFRKLLHEAKQSAKSSLIVNVSNDNENVLKMYKSIGFNHVDRSLNEEIMQLDLQKQTK
jgi:L-amino acid N-acyltransferase YncA